MPETDQFFVYGTLKSDQCRFDCWPRRPTTVARGWVWGRLFERPDGTSMPVRGDHYPALSRGQHRVAGELWTFARVDVDAVRRVLDRIEVTDQPGTPDLYTRRVVEVFAIESEVTRKSDAVHSATDRSAARDLRTRAAQADVDPPRPADGDGVSSAGRIDRDIRSLGTAFAYFYATPPEDDGFVLIPPDAEGKVDWSPVWTNPS